MDTHDYYIGKLVYDDAWGFGLITKKNRHDNYEVWWYDNPPDREWTGEVDRLYIIKFDAHKWVHDNYVLKKEMP